MDSNTHALPSNQLKVWISAFRPKTLTASIVPVIAAMALAVQVGSDILWYIPVLALLVSLFIQIGTNLINDALDFKKGADTQDRLGPMRVTQTGLLPLKTVFLAGLASLGLAFTIGLPLVYVGGWIIGLLLLASIICAYIYTGGPAPLAYHGLGDLFVFLFFGLASTISIFYLLTGQVNTLSLVAGAQIGLLATVLIAINNLRDHAGDAKARKKTLAVRFGKTFSRWEITLLILLPFALNYFWFMLEYQKVAIFTLISLPIGVHLVYSIWATEPGAIYNKFLAKAALLHLSFGILLSIGILLT